MRQTQTEKKHPRFHNCHCATTLDHKGIVHIIALFVSKELIENLHLKFEYYFILSQASLLLLIHLFKVFLAHNLSMSITHATANDISIHATFYLFYLFLLPQQFTTLLNPQPPSYPRQYSKALQNISSII